MPKENPSFLDRVNSAQQAINRGYQNEEDRRITEIKRDLTEIGVISAFQDIINNRIVSTESDSDKPIYIEYGSSFNKEGCFLVFMDQKKIIKNTGNSDWTDDVRINKQAIGIVNLGHKYQIGCYFESFSCWAYGTDYRPNIEPFYSENIGTKLVDKHEVLDTIARVAVILKHNQEERGKRNPNYLKFP